jgi:DNA-binding NarL/FixJ family response regulator
VKPPALASVYLSGSPAGVAWAERALEEYPRAGHLEADALVLLDDGASALARLDDDAWGSLRRTVVVTSNGAALYHDLLYRARVSAVVGYDARSVAAAVGAVAAGQRLRPERLLTPQEARVLTLLMRGLDTPIIAERMGVSMKTVTSHVSNVLTRYALSGRAALVAHAYGGGVPLAGRATLERAR